MATGLFAGAAKTNITPIGSQFLYGYPFAERMSEGVHDCLLSSALYLANGAEQLLLISNDLIYVSKSSVSRIRKLVSENTGIPSSKIMIAATHTHSGPVTVASVIDGNDPIVPRPDPEYVKYMEDKTIDAACKAFRNASSAQTGFILADGTGAGTNRYDPSGPADMDIPVLVIRKPDKEFVACLLICNMHPTVLHEDSRLFSGDFPAFTREILQKDYLGCECPVLYFTGAAGNQSPRHVTRANTIEEAHRIGGIIAKAVGSKISDGVEFSSEVPVSSVRKFINLPRRKFPEVIQAREYRDKVLSQLEVLRKSSENLKEIRTAEVNWFGAEESLYLSQLAEKGELEDAYNSCLPAEIQVFKIGPWIFAAWPGEIFVEYVIKLKKSFDDLFLITIANGELQGYIATEEAEKKGLYEASNSIFHHSAGDLLVEETIKLLKTGY